MNYLTVITNHPLPRFLLHRFVPGGVDSDITFRQVSAPQPVPAGRDRFLSSSYTLKTINTLKFNNTQKHQKVLPEHLRSTMGGAKHKFTH